MDRGKGLKEVLRAVFGKDKESDLEQVEETKEKVLAAEQELPKQMDWRESGRLSPVEGNLLKLWKKWAGDTLHPSLTLTEEIEEDSVALDSEQMQREAKRAMGQLEQEAEKRMRQLEDLVKQGQPETLSAKTFLYVSQDKMLAWIFVFPPIGEGDGARPDEIGMAMQKARVLNGINNSVIIRLIQEKPYFRMIPIAMGTPAEQGTDGEIKKYYDEQLPFEVKIDEDGVADYKASNYVRQIMKGDVLCDITYPVPGKPGVRVDGSVAEPKKIQEIKIPQGANTELTEDGLHLIASIDGDLDYRNGVFQISPVLVIPGDVDYNVGNINFKGDVCIKGDVRENFSVTATGSITVAGLVEAADITAGGDLLISRGVVGDNGALIRSEGCIRVKFLENCVAYAKESVYADCIMNSTVFSDNSINVTSGRGSVIGGSLTAAERINARMLGAQSGKRTQLRLGVLSYSKSEAQSAARSIERGRHEMDDVEHQIKELSEQGVSVNDPQMAKLRLKHTALELKEKKMTPQQEEETEEQLIPDLERCRLECEMAYPNTTLTVANASWSVRESKMHCKVRYDAEAEVLKEVY